MQYLNGARCVLLHCTMGQERMSRCADKNVAQDSSNTFQGLFISVFAFVYEVMFAFLNNKLIKLVCTLEYAFWHSMAAIPLVTVPRECEST